MDNKDNEKKYGHNYEYEIFFVTIIIFIIIFISKSEYIKKCLHNLIKQETKLKNEGYTGVIIFIIIGVILNQGIIFYILVNTSCGFIFGFKKGFIIAYIIVLISSIVGFYLSRYIFKNKITDSMKNNNKLNEIYERQENLTFYDWVKYTVLLRISPMSFNINNYLLGTTNVDIISYMVGTSIGVIPWLMIEIFVGSKVSNVNKLYNYI
jgi:uncharacterized membrane protein YdjX (TVP38/TMEM64 family)